MKELWIEINESLSGDLKSSLLKAAFQVCGVVLVGAKDVENAKKTGVKIAASSDESDINVLSTFDESKVNELKRMGKSWPIPWTVMVG